MLPLQPVSQGRVIRGTAAYFLVSTLQRGVSFLMLPVFAIVLTPSEFGQIGIVGTVAGAIAALLGLGLETSIFRNLVQLRGQPSESRRFLNTVGLFAIAAPTLAAAALAWPLGILVETVYGVPAVIGALGAIGAGLSVGVTSVCFAALRAEERLGRYVLLGGVHVVLHAGLPLWLVVVQGAGVTGWFAGTAIGSALLLLLGLGIAGHRFSADFDRRYLAAALAFGVPMVPHALSHWGLALSDRVVLGGLVSNADLGVYHVAYQFGLPIVLLAGAVAQSAQPLYAEASLDRGQPTDNLSRVATYQVLAVAFAGVSVAVLAGPAIRILLPEPYGPGAALVPWIALGMTLFGLYLIPMNVVVLLVGRNRWLWVITLSAAIANIALNVTLAPVLGITAAAINTAIGYALLLGGILWYAKRVANPPVGYEWARIALGSTVIAAPLILLAFQASNPWIDTVLRMAALGLQLGVLFVLKLLPPTLLRLDWIGSAGVKRNGREA